MSGHVFVFLKARLNRIELLVWDRTGFVLVYERLERAPSRSRHGRGLAVDTWHSTPESWV